MRRRIWIVFLLLLLLLLRKVLPLALQLAVPSLRILAHLRAGRLVFAGILRILGMLIRRLITLIDLRMLWASLLLRLLLQTLGLVLIRAVLVYPALPAVASFSADPAKWGPTKLLLLRVRGKLLLLAWILLVLVVFWGYFGIVWSALLEERIEVVLVLLV